MVTILSQLLIKSVINTFKNTWSKKKQDDAKSKIIDNYQFKDFIKMINYVEIGIIIRSKNLEVLLLGMLLKIIKMLISLGMN